MKRILLVLMFVLALGGPGMVFADQWDGQGGPALELSGGKMATGSAVILGSVPRVQSSIAVPCRASVNITKGDAVILDTATTYYVSVSEVATAGAANVFGIALNTATYGTVVYVAKIGVVRCATAANVTKGMLMVQSATAGLLTNCSAVTPGVIAEGSYYTAISGSPIVAVALETKTLAAFSTGFFLGWVMPTW